MTTCCPNCPATAYGTEAASLCTECATATVAGASVDLPTLFLGVAVACAAYIAFRAVRSAAALLGPTERAALA